MERGGGLGRSLEAGLREAVRSGRLAAGVRLPSTRSLAADLGIARGTVVAAYAQLVAEGWLVGLGGSGTRVAGSASFGSEAVGAVAPLAPTESLESDLRPGRPDISSFPRVAWAASVRRVVAGLDVGALDYGEPGGILAARTAIAEYVGRTRGVWGGAESVVITAGFTHGLGLLARAMRRLGVGEVATEDPGLGRHREVLRAAGLGVVALELDEGGADPGGLSAGVGAALLTPAHQFPWGVVLAPGRRTAFIEWARKTGGYLIEDDYDAEFRYDQQPVGAMQPLAPDRVVFAGSTSKTLAPGMRLGWLVVPAALREAVLEAIEETGAAVPAIEQLALADLIRRGDYDRHIRRVRLVYRRRRGELAQRLAAVGSTPLAGVTAGLHALLPVGSADRERELVAAARRNGLRLHGLHTADYWHRPQGRPAALIIGYATPAPHAWRRSLDALTSLIAEG